MDLTAPLVLAQEQLNNQTVYVYGLGDSPLASEAGGVWRYLSGRDALNSVRQETDAAGQVLAVRRFDPYGVPLTPDGGQPYGYSGEWWDAGTELVYLRARYLRPELGLFTSRDPWPGDVRQPGTLQGYGYVGGNPLRYTDPTGQSQACPEGDQSFGCGSASELDYIWQYFAENGRYAWFADAYASLFVANQAEFRGAPCAEGLRDAADQKMAEAVAFLPQRDWRADIPMAIDPGSALQVGPTAAAVVRAGAPLVRQLARMGGVKPNTIGNGGVRDVGNRLGVRLQQERVTGGARIYDGYDPQLDLSIEVKTTTRGRVSPSPAIRAQIAFDGGKPVLWIFVDGGPTASLERMLRASGIPYTIWYR